LRIGYKMGRGEKVKPLFQKKPQGKAIRSIEYKEAKDEIKKKLMKKYDEARLPENLSIDPSLIDVENYR